MTDVTYPSEVLEEVAAALDLDPEELDPDADLISLGLDSLRLMRLLQRWRKRGFDRTFADLAAAPRLSRWLDWWHDLDPAAPPPAPEGTAAPATGDPGEPFDLTAVQRAYWQGRADEQVLGGVGCHVYFEFDQDAARAVAADPLEATVRDLVRRHEMLRARVDEDGRQRVLPVSPWPGPTVTDLRHTTDVDGELARVRRERSHRRLDVARGEVFDVALTLLPDGGTRVHLQLDLIVGDVMSLEILFRELAAGLAGQRPGPAPGVRFAEYLAIRPARRAEEHRRWWHDRLADLPLGPALPLAADPSTLTRPRFHRRSHLVPHARWARFSEVCRSYGCTPSVALATAYAEVLANWSDGGHFLLNLPVFDRQDVHPDIDRVIADFTSLVLVPVDCTRPAPFAERTEAVAQSVREALAHADHSGVDVARDLSRRHQLATPAAPVVFTSTLGTRLFDAEVTDHLGSPVYAVSQTPQVHLDHQVYETPEGVLLVWDAVDDLFPAGTLDAMFATYQQFVESLALTTTWEHQARFPLPAEQRAVRDKVNSTQAPYPPRTLGADLAERALERPGAPAVIDGERTLSYRELWSMSLRVGGWLTAHGVTPGSRVTVRLPRSAEAVAAVLGVHAAGAAYVPVGVDQPPARRERIRERCAPVREIDEECLAEALAHPHPLSGPVETDPHGAAYVFFTSGSTGAPKGVEVSHAAARNTVRCLVDRAGVGPEDRVLAVSAMAFDLSVFDVFGVLGAGGTLVVVPPESWRDARVWCDLVRRHRVTLWNSVPALLEMLLTAAEGPAHGDALRSLRLALVSGDWVGLNLSARLHARAGARLTALGGATEAAIWSNAMDVPVTVPPDWVSVPYGYPLRAQRFRVVDPLGRDRPDWAVGELWIGGAGVALGYAGDPTLTAERFVEADGERWYRTGDMGRYRPDGALEFLGRRDQQVKVRGHRIELGEIDSALESDPEVAHAVSLVETGPDGHRRLLSVVVGRDGQRPDGRRLRRVVRALLPPSMVPELVVVADSLPLSSNGKVDRPALSARLGALTEDEEHADTEPPRPGAEERVAGIWAEVLGAQVTDRQADFFALGGDSLTATRVLARLGEAGYTDVGVAALFRHPRLRRFAAELGDPQTTTSTSPTALVPDPAGRHEPFALTPVQRAYWLGRDARLELGGCGTTYYLEFDTGRVDEARLRDAWRQVVERHDMLRAVVSSEGQQRVLPDPGPATVDVRQAADRDSARRWLSEEVARREFDLADWPAHHLAVAHYADRSRIGLAVDYTLLDGLSILLLLEELAAGYQGRTTTEVAPTFRDYVHQSPPPGERARQYWLDRLDSLPQAPALPLAQAPAQVTRPRFTRRAWTLPTPEWDQLCARAREVGVTPSTALLTAYVRTLADWSDQRELTVNLTLFDRREVHPDVDRILGDFTTLLLLGCHLAPGDNQASLSRRVQQRLGADLEHREFSAVDVQRERARRGTSLVVPVVFTSVLSVGGRSMANSTGFLGDPVDGLTSTPQVWLDHQVFETGAGVTLVWDSLDALFPEGDLDRRFAAYQELVRELTTASGWHREFGLPTGRTAPPAEVGPAPSPAEVGEAAGRPPEEPDEATALVERRLAALWRELLNVDRVRPGDDFLSLGGDSLRGMRLLTGIERAFGVSVPFERVLVSGLRELATLVADSRRTVGPTVDEGEL
ncbi:amino acid adenylation domain-containing protein [Streptomyces sp. NPDC005438]|uniref:amino acid adenylation domain-containing protein n=1 Tax=Streptomyces sp. NPDC005438 TaxID=3156880 RepID=UPI00339E5496